MKIIKPYYEIITPLRSNHGGEVIIKRITNAARVCYKSEGKSNFDSDKKLVENLIDNGHEAMLEHASVTVKFVVDRGVSHELVRHRLASFAQESTRYCNYTQEKFGSEITFIKPCFFDDTRPEYAEQKKYTEWYTACWKAEDSYFNLLAAGATPEQARDVLPMSVKTEVVMTANMREWRHFFALRAVQVTGKAHPQMVEVAVPLLREFASCIPVVFDDLIEKL